MDASFMHASPTTATQPTVADPVGVCDEEFSQLALDSDEEEDTDVLFDAAFEYDAPRYCDFVGLKHARDILGPVAACTESPRCFWVEERRLNTQRTRIQRAVVQAAAFGARASRTSRDA
jgi:hypothetical protein